MPTRLLSASGLAAALAVLVASHSAFSQTVADEVIVTGTRVPVPGSQAGGSITAIDRGEFEREQDRSLVDALEGVPGSHIVQSGGPGHQSSMFVRGTNSNHVLVLIDGIEVGDPSAPAGAFDFGNLFLGGIDRIEVLRGAQASTYGSEAIGGVVNLMSATPTEDALALTAEGGSFGTFNQRVRGSAVGEAWGVGLSLSHLKSHGESVTADRFTPAGGSVEEDGFENYSASLRLDGQPRSNLDLGLVVHALDTQSEVDPTAEDPDANSQTQQVYARAEASAILAAGLWAPTLGLNVTSVRREFFNYPDALADTFQARQDTGGRLKADLRNDIFAFDNHLVSVGLGYEQETLDSTQFSNFGGFVIQGASDETAITRTAYVQDIYSWRERLFVTADVRHDRDQRFDGKTTYRVAPVYAFESGTRLRAVYGTGFRAPALFELFGSTASAFGPSFQGNRNLRPEESRSWEVGVDQPLFGDGALLSLTYFESEIDDLIVASGFPTVPNNVDRADINGVEAVLSASLTDEIGATLAYTFTSAENAATGQVLLRRPKHKVDADVTWEPVEGARLTALLSYVGETRDAGFNGGTLYRGGYTVVDVRADWTVRPNVRVFGRIDNLFDNDYEVTDGFRGGGRGAFVGATVAF